MPISTNDLIKKFGTVDSIDDGSTSAISNNAFSVAADITAWTNDEDAPYAMFILKCQWGTVTSVANRSVIIHARPINIDSTNDPVAPSANRLMPIGFFNVYAAAITTDYYFESSICELPNMKSSQEYEFYLENQSAQTISSGWTLKIVPIAFGPKA